MRSSQFTGEGTEVWTHLTGLRAAGEQDLSPVRLSSTVVLFAVPGPSGVLSSVSLSLVGRLQWL